MARELSCEEKSRLNTTTMASSGGGFCYSEVSPTSHQYISTTQIQHFDDHHHHHDHHHHQPNNNTEIFNLTSGMDMIGFSRPSKDHHMWSEHDHHHHQQHQNLIQPEAPFMVDDSSLRCVFPCEGNERPSQGLSLTLSSNNPSSIGLQAFELRHTANIQPNSNSSNNNNMSLLHLRNSKFLAPTQELLNEFCSLGTKQADPPKKSQKSKLQWELDQDSNNNGASSSSQKHSLYSLEFMELQKRKSKLLSMLEEVERRYKKYCDQMRAVVSSFEAVAGAGAAGVYSALASRAMSRHFRCLKDGIAAQILATRKAMGEKDAAAAPGPGVPGASRGETPRLRILDQTLRQQRAFQQMSMMESHPWRPQRGLPERSVSVLRAWLFEHFLHPYPSDVDKHILARQTGLSRSQVSNWFINARVRLWKPMVEEMYMEETKEAQLDGTNPGHMAGGTSSDGGGDVLGLVGPTDQKPTVDQLVRIDSECLSSVVINPDKNDFANMRSSQMQAQRHQSFGRFPDSAPFGAVELDFSAYSDPAVAANQAFGGVSGGISLTLGLQQHAGHGGASQHGVSLAFSPSTNPSSMFYPRSSSDHHHHHHQQHHHRDHQEMDGQDPDEEDDRCQEGVQYSLLDNDQGQNLHYRNLMGAQLLHDLA